MEYLDSNFRKQIDFQVVKNKIIDSQSEDIFLKYVYWKDSTDKINGKDFSKFVLNKINSWNDFYNLNNNDINYNILFDILCEDPKISVIQFDGITKYIYFPLNVTMLLMKFISKNL